jgi:hypothetical protein
MKEVLFRILQWKDGLYEFIPEQIRYNKAILKPQSAESVLMDCFRMMDEWPGVQKKIGSVENVFRPLIEANEITESAEGFSEEEKRVLQLMDGHRSLQEITYVSRLGTFDTARAVAGLIDRGLVAKSDLVSQTRMETKFGKSVQEATRTWLIASYKYLFLLFVFGFVVPWAAFALRSYTAAKYEIYTPSGRIYDQTPSLADIMRRNHASHIRVLLNLYRFEKGDYPSSLRDIVRDDVAEQWTYQKLEGSYTLK